MDCPVDLYKLKKEDELTEFADNADAIIKATGEPVRVLYHSSGLIEMYCVEDVEGNRRLIAKSGLVILNDCWEVSQ